MLGWLLVALIAVVLWPQRFGGQTAFVVVHGHSMEPTFHMGDVLLVRSVDGVEPGDVAVYQVPSGLGAGENIVHRVVRVEGDGTLVLRGDAKDQPDDVRPHLDDLVGRPVMNLGSVPLRVLNLIPLLAAVVVALAIGWLLWPEPLEPRERPAPAGTVSAAEVLAAWRREADARRSPSGAAQA